MIALSKNKRGQALCLSGVFKPPDVYLQLPLELEEPLSISIEPQLVVVLAEEFKIGGSVLELTLEPPLVIK